MCESGRVPATKTPAASTGRRAADANGICSPRGRVRPQLIAADGRVCRALDERWPWPAARVRGRRRSAEAQEQELARAKALEQELELELDLDRELEMELRGGKSVDQPQGVARALPIDLKLM